MKWALCVYAFVSCICAVLDEWVCPNKTGLFINLGIIDHWHVTFITCLKGVCVCLCVSQKAAQKNTVPWFYLFYF